MAFPHVLMMCVTAIVASLLLYVLRDQRWWTVALAIEAGVVKFSGLMSYHSYNRLESPDKWHGGQPAVPHSFFLE